MAENRSDDRREDDDDKDKATKREGNGVMKASAAKAKPKTAVARDEDTDDRDGESDDGSDVSDEAPDSEPKPRKSAQPKASEKVASKARTAAVEDDEDESEQDEDDEQDEEPAPKAKPKGSLKGATSKKDVAKGEAKPAAKPTDQGLMTPTNIALLLAAGGLGSFWKGWDLYRSEGRDFYSGSAWLFLIAFFMVTVSALHFLGGQLRAKAGDKHKNLLEALVPALPFFALYAVIWWVAWDTWSVMYAKNNHWMWMFFIALAFVSWGVWYALRPPSEAEAKADEMPTRRVILLLMLPFVTVFGMIWLAERVVPPH